MNSKYTTSAKKIYIFKEKIQVRGFSKYLRLIGNTASIHQISEKKNYSFVKSLGVRCENLKIYNGVVKSS